MKPILISIAAGSLLAWAQAPRYRVIDLGTPGLGGSTSIAFGVNNAGRVAGSASVPDGTQHAALWGPGGIIDAGSLGGNAQSGPPNGRDELPIISETSAMDPLGEDFCAFQTGKICLGAIWRNGALTALPTLGGNNAAAISLNNRGQIDGFAEIATQDSTCIAPQKVRVEAAIWGPNPGQIQALPPLSGDTVGFALGINDLGDAVGSSGTCANTPLLPMPFGPHAVLWHNGVPANLGSLGGTFSTAAAINNRGQAAGASNLPGDTALHSFLWSSASGLQDLGTIGADDFNFATWINNAGDVVGTSCAGALCRAYVWRSGAGMLDLNTLVPADSPLYLATAFGINDAGEIAGLGLDANFNPHAYLAVPVSGGIGSNADRRAVRPMALPPNFRRFARPRIANHDR